MLKQPTDASPFPGHHRGLDRRHCNAPCQPLAGRRQVDGGLLGPLGARRQQGLDRAVPGMGREEQGRGQIDYITSQGHKNLLTIAAEQQARSGHDIMAFPTWQPHGRSQSLEPVDDVMAELIKQNGNVNKTVEYLGSRQQPLDRRADLRRQPDQGAVLAHRPAEEACRYRRAGDVSRRARRRRLTPGPWTPCSRPPRPATRPASRSASGSARPRTTSTPPARSSSRSAPTLVDAKGNITVKTDAGAPGARILQEAGAVAAAGRAGLGQRLQQQVSDRRQGLADHEPAERLGGRQARRAAGRRAIAGPTACRPARRGATRRSCPTSGASGTSARTRPRPRSLLLHLSQPAAVEKMVDASAGYDLPAFEKLTTFKVWAEEGPPKGTLYHYPEPAQSPDPLGRGRARAAEDRPADLHPGDP